MSVSPNDILSSALALPERDRIRLAAELLDSIAGRPPGLSTSDPEFESELNRRLSDGRPTIPWEDVQRRLEGDLSQ